MPTSAHNNKSHRSSGSSDKSSGSVGSSSSAGSPSPDEEVQRRMLQRLQQSEREDIAGNYFKPKRATELLNRAKHDASNAFSTWKDFSRNKSTGSSSPSNNALNSSLNQSGLHLSLNALNLNSSMNGTVNNGYLGSSWGNSINNNWPGSNHNSSPETGMRRPIRLEALPVLDRKPAGNKRRVVKTELNTMDII